MSTATVFQYPPWMSELRATAPPRIRLLLWVLLGVGVAAFIILFVRDRDRLWYDYLANFLFFTGLAQAGVVWSAVTRGCNGRWARPLQRMAESTAVVLPLAVLLYIPIILARRTLYPWWGHPDSAKLPWLNPWFLIGRDLGILIFMAGLGLAYRHASLQPAAVGQRRLGRLWVLMIFAFVYLYSVLGLDLNLSLNLHWYDYIYGWYFFITHWYAGLALISVLAVCWRHRLGLQAVITTDILHDNAEITFGFCVFWAYLFWAQFMVLWFANRQDDIFVLLRLSEQRPWITLGWVTLTLGFFLPFAFGLSRTWKRRPATLVYIASLSLAAMWLEQNLMVDVSLWFRGFPPLLSSAALACGFLGGYGLLYLRGLARVPFFPLQDPMMAEALVISPPRH